MKKLKLSFLALGMLSSSFLMAQTPANNSGVGVQYNNYGGFSTFNNGAMGVLKLTHGATGNPWQTYIFPSGMPSGSFLSPINLSMDYLNSAQPSYRFSRIVFTDRFLNNTNGTQSTFVAYGSSYANPSNPDMANDLAYHSYVANGQDFIYDKFRIGVNTKTPKALLHVQLKKDNLYSTSAIQIQSDHTAHVSQQYADVTFTSDLVKTRSASTDDREWVIRSNSWDSQYLPQTLEFKAPQFDKPHVYFSGNNIKVGIGVFPGNGPYQMKGNYQLYVATGILTEKLKVATIGSTQWADYVFDENYTLRDLAEVEDFIDKNHHLPDVPSAAEVDENGVDMVEMDATLLRKIEELTLYVIELKKENERIQTQLSELGAIK